jgi:hypothetical protein
MYNTLLFKEVINEKKKKEISRIFTFQVKNITYKNLGSLEIVLY